MLTHMLKDHTIIGEPWPLEDRGAWGVTIKINGRTIKGVAYVGDNPDAPDFETDDEYW
jgi:hypothetical protein